MRALISMLILSASTAHADPVAAARVGWAYGIGAELEYRPGSWGAGVSGGYVPGLGFGGYLGAQWGQHPIAESGFVAEAGAFRGVHSAFREAADGYGAYALGGYTLHESTSISIRGVLGGGVPLDDPAHRPSFEFLAKLTVGVVF
jgi:hypothetical protein